MPERTMTLGTLFTANVADFLAGTRRVRAEMQKLAQYNSDLRKRTRALNQTMEDSTKQYNRATSSAKKLATAHNDVNKSLNRTTQGFERIKYAMKITTAYGIAAGLVYNFVQALQIGVDEIISFDQSLRNLEAITGATSAEISIMKDTIVDTATRTKYSTTEIADGMVLLGQAGFKATESINAIQAVADLAAGTLSEMRTTADLLTTTIRAFSLDSIEAARVADVMANAINKSKLTIDKLRISFNYVGSVAHQVGLSLEETAASMMVMANTGMRASTIGTGLRQVLSKLMAPTRKIRDAFEENGIELDKVNPKLVGFQASIHNLRKVLIRDNGLVDMAKAFEMFGLRGAQAAAVIAKSFGPGGAFQEALDYTYKVGSAQEMMGIQAEGLGFKFKNLADRAKNLAIALGDAGLVGVLHVLVDTLRSAVQAITDFAESGIGKTTLQIGVWTLAIISATAAVKGFFAILSGTTIGLTIHNLATTFGTLSITMGRVAAAFSVLKTYLVANPWIFLAGAIAAVGVAIYKWRSTLDESIMQQQRLVAETDQAVSSLELYYEAIKNTKEGSREYKAIIERLKDAHPELRDEIDKNAHSYEDLAAAIKKAGDAQFEQGLIERVKEMNLLSKKLKEAVKEYQLYNEWQVSRNAASGKQKKTLHDFIKESKDATAIFKDLSDKVQVFAQKLFTAYEGENLNAARWKAKAILIRAGYDPDVIEEMLAEIDAHFMRFVKRQAENEKKEVNAARISDSAAQKKLSQEKTYYTLLSRMEDDRRKQIDANYKTRSADIQRWYKDEVERLTKLKYSTDEADRKRDTLNAANARKRNEDLAKYELEQAKRRIDIKKLEIQEQMELEKQTSLGDSSKIEDLKSREKEVQLNYLREIEAAYEAYYKKVVSIFGEESKEAQDAKTLWLSESLKATKTVTDQERIEAKKRIKNHIDELKAKLKTVEEYSDEWKKIVRQIYELEGYSAEEFTGKLNDAFKKTFKNIEEGYRQGKVSAEEYAAAVEKARVAGTIDEDDAQRRQASMSGDWIDKLKYGLQEANKSAETFGETLVGIGENIVDQVSGNFASAFSEFIEGSKDAGEAFRSFAQSTLKWTLEIITKTLVARAIMSSMSGLLGGGGGNVNVTPTLGASGMYYSALAHSGGILGKKSLQRRMVDPRVFQFAPRLHKGLKADEFPAILQRGEEVRTKKQRESDAASMAPVVQVFNSSGQPAKTKSEQTADGRSLVKVFIGEAAADIAKGGVLGRTMQAKFGLNRVGASR